MTEAKAVDLVQTELDELIDDAEAELGRSLDDDEYADLLDEFLTGLDDNEEE
jgi:hypothetical protein